MRSESAGTRSGRNRRQSSAVYTVSQVNAYIKNIFSKDFALRAITVSGEVSNCKYHTSGHIYFTLKDATGTLAAVMFAGDRSGLSFVLREGQKVAVTGSITVYERDGTYQLIARKIRPDGVGALYLALEERKARLAEMGMFAPEYKQPIPAFASRIGIVTAPTGAAIRDIVTIAHRRNPYVQLILCPAIVQGQEAAASIVKGIERLDALGLDCLIVGRGGGSIEDLWPFNEESVARAIFDCRTPVISAVGHETDTTIADYVADLRAPTPSAAAELAVYELSGLLDSLEKAGQKLDRQMRGKIAESRLKVLQATRRLESQTPRSRLEERRRDVQTCERLLRERMRDKMEESRKDLELAATRLEALSPLARMQSGYAFVTGEDGRAVQSIRRTRPGDAITVTVRDGQIRALVQTTTEQNSGERAE